MYGNIHLPLFCLRGIGQHSKFWRADGNLLYNYPLIRIRRILSTGIERSQACNNS